MAGAGIKWSELLLVAEVSLAFGVGIVSVFALGVLSLDRLRSARVAGAAGAARQTVLVTRVGGYLLAVACFVTCVCAIGYGLYLIVPQFHR